MRKIYIASGLKIEKGQWNTGFDNMARRDSEGDIFATDKSRKYSLRQELLLNGEKVLIRKRKDEGQYMSLSNILKKELSVPYNKNNWKESVQELFLKNIDIRLFGFIINPKGFSANAHGSFQLSYAKDVKKTYTEEIILDITSYKTSKETNEDMTTIGKQIIIDKGYLNYTIAINPNTYKKEFLNNVNFKEIPETLFLDDNDELDMGRVDDYIAEYFKKDLGLFLEALRTDVTNTSSCLKNGANNLYNVIVTMNDNKSAINENLFSSVVIENDNIDFTNTLAAIIESKNKIEKIQIEIASEINISEFISALEKEGISVEVKDLFA